MADSMREALNQARIDVASVAIERKKRELRKASDEKHLGEADSLVPDSSYASSYVSRVLDYGITEFKLFDYALREGMNVLIEGPTGPGKTHACLAYAAERGYPFYNIHSHSAVEPSALFGKQMQNSSGLWDWQDGPLTALLRHSHTRPVVLLIDEINFISPKIASVLFPLLDHRRQISLADNRGELLTAGDMLILAAQNPGYTNTRDLSPALRNRFPITLWWDYDEAVEARLIRSPALLEMAKSLRESYNAGDHSTPISTNMLMEFCQIAGELGVAFAITNFLNKFRQDERAAMKIVVEANRTALTKDFTAKEQPKRKDRGRGRRYDREAESPFGTDELGWAYQRDERAVEAKSAASGGR